MASDMRAPSSGKKSETSHGVEKCGVSDQACHGKCQSCDIDVKPCAGVDGVSSLTGSHIDVKASKENCRACSFNNDRADALEEEVKGSTARIGHVESADPDGCVDVKKESFMAVDDLPQDSEGEQAGATLEDLFFFNGKEEDDSDWEPASRLVENRWFCFNCTMPIVDEITHSMVTPAGYSWMTSLLADCSNGRLLVILEGGYNLRLISSSATEVVKVLLGDGPNRASFVGSPSREALKTVSQVLKIQQQFWPVLGPTYASLQAQQGSVSSNHSNELKKRKHSGGLGPFWWKLGSKRLNQGVWRRKSNWFQQHLRWVVR
ncbi:unnamed protein product [Miscanthus lutarioriparius]|uniref:histone deacetylase n=1 Tax=Miscanthus lutarioriparius TaxID=422564 RepID=A0A811NHR0_9POAL|nr:unnamed protein product [Miscanthus lutarioriparius]